MKACVICGNEIDDSGTILSTNPPKEICGKCNFERYLAKSTGDVESHRAYFEQFSYSITRDIAEALDADVPGLGLVKLVTEATKWQGADAFQGERYEYDIVTILNKDHGAVNKVHMLNVLREHASQGWRLHTIYSNELGKNAVQVLGLGVNATACEDVMIFERRLGQKE